MSPPKRPKPAAPRLVSSEYGNNLRAAAERAGVGWEKLAAEARISPVSAWRVQRGTGSIKAAMALRGALERRGQKLPPPVVADGLGPEDLDEWHKLGQRLYTLDHEQFLRALSQVRDYLKSLESVDAGISLIEHPLPRNKS